MRSALNSLAGHRSYTREGITVSLPTPLPPLPRDWQLIALRVAIALAISMMGVAIVWSTYSIGTLLGGGIGFAAAVVFDVSWIIVLVLEYLARFDAEKRRFPQVLGWGLLGVTMAAIAWEGLAQEPRSWGMAIFGAMVSLVAKTLTLAVMEHVNVELSPEDRVWIKEVTSKVQTKAVVAQVRRTAARDEVRATKQLLAMERELQIVRESYGLPEPVEDEETIEPASAITPPSLTDMPPAYAIRFAASQRPELDETDLAELLADQGVEVTATEVRQILSVTPRTSVEA